MNILVAEQKNSATQYQPAPHLLLPDRTTTHFLKLYDIISVQAMNNYCKVHCSNRKQPIVVAKTLKWFQERLPEEWFSRVHHGHMINTNRIVSITGNMIFLENGISAFISRRKKAGVAKALRA